MPLPKQPRNPPNLNSVGEILNNHSPLLLGRLSRLHTGTGGQFVQGVMTDMSNANDSVTKGNKLIVEIVGLGHPMLGKRIMAMVGTDEGFQIMTDDGLLFLAVGASDIVQLIGGDCADGAIKYRSHRKGH
jgi:hypothetical protein